MKGKFKCCFTKESMAHEVLGAGAGLLLVHYLGITDILTWGWLLLGAGLLWHLMKK